jgi:hypothetical protein
MRNRSTMTERPTAIGLIPDESEIWLQSDYVTDIGAQVRAHFSTDAFSGQKVADDPKASLRKL